MSAYEIYCTWCQHLGGLDDDHFDNPQRHWCGCECPPIEHYAIPNGPQVIRCDGCGATWTYEDQWCKPGSPVEALDAGHWIGASRRRVLGRDQPDKSD